MSIGITEEHDALADAVRGWAGAHAPVSTARAIMDAGSGDRPVFWDGLAAQGLLGMHIAVDRGGGGAGPVELAVGIEQLGYGMVAGPFLPTVTVSALLTLAPGATDDRLTALADGTRTAALLPPSAPLQGRRDGDKIRLDGSVRPVLGATQADVLLVCAGTEDGEAIWALVDAGAADVGHLESLDGTRPVATVSFDGVTIDGGDVVAGLDAGTVRAVAVTLAAAEAAGIAAWCLDTAVGYAKVREQFGRPIGQFQAVKHACADLLVLTEQTRAVAWDAARALDDPDQRPLAAAVAGAVALDAAVQAAKSCIQILGGIGFTWEHDAHLYLRRALTLRQLWGPASAWRAEAARLALGGSRRRLELDLADDEATGLRGAIRELVASLEALDDDERRRRIADTGYLQPHWPRPWGRDAGAVEQLVIDEEFTRAGIRRPDLVIGGWILPTIIGHGTDEQRERFVRPTLHGEITWCQMFSEPDAGSDLAALQTRATRTDGGWLLTGQKIWTSLAQSSDWGLCLARTDPQAPKHEGITAFLVDMASPGLDIRPLRELTGHAMFNEVFLDDVFVPDDLVVGAVNDGWRAGRTTLANERVAMSTGSTMGAGVEGVLRAVTAQDTEPDGLTLDRVGALVCEGQVLSLLGLRTTLRRLQGADPGAASSVRKLVGMHHAQDCAELALELLGPEGATAEGVAGKVGGGFLQSRCLTIAGGTTEVQRNVVAERILGLPRDP